MISDRALQEFREIWKEEVGEEIDDDVAVEEAINLLTITNAIYRPIKKEWAKELLDEQINQNHDNDSTKNE